MSICLKQVDLMKAKLITEEQPGGKRIPISKLLPLNTPLIVQIFPVYACNFTCKYCTMSIKKSDREFISNTVKLDLDLFKKCVDDLKQFPNKIKVLRFVGMGEPLLHKQLPEMIQYASNAKIFERIEVITNASLLSEAMSDALIYVGITKLLISIQGTSAEKYKEISDVDIDFDQLLHTIKYFYDNKKDAMVHIKIADCALDNKKDEELFYELFGDMCDTIGIEYIGPIHSGVQYNKELETQIVNQYGAKLINNNICSTPFYVMQINPDGNIVPCHSLSYPIIIGNCNEKSLLEIWNGKRFRRFQRKMLNGISNMPNEWPCTKCILFKHRACDSDDLDNKAEKLKKYYE